MIKIVLFFKYIGKSRSKTINFILIWFNFGFLNLLYNVLARIENNFIKVSTMFFSTCFEVKKNKLEMSFFYPSTWTMIFDDQKMHPIMTSCLSSLWFVVYFLTKCTSLTCHAQKCPPSSLVVFSNLNFN